MPGLIPFSAAEKRRMKKKGKGAKKPTNYSSSRNRNPRVASMMKDMAGQRRNNPGNPY